MFAEGSNGGLVCFCSLDKGGGCFHRYRGIDLGVYDLWA